MQTVPMTAELHLGSCYTVTRRRGPSDMESDENY